MEVWAETNILGKCVSTVNVDATEGWSKVVTLRGFRELKSTTKENRKTVEQLKYALRRCRR